MISCNESFGGRTGACCRAALKVDSEMNVTNAITTKRANDSSTVARRQNMKRPHGMCRSHRVTAQAAANFEIAPSLTLRAVAVRRPITFIPWFVLSTSALSIGATHILSELQNVVLGIPIQPHSGAGAMTLKQGASVCARGSSEQHPKSALFTFVRSLGILSKLHVVHPIPHEGPLPVLVQWRQGCAQPVPIHSVAVVKSR